MSNLTWVPMRPAQAKALGRVARAKDAPSAYLVARDEDTGTLIVVPASSKDRRRWDVTKGGKITRQER